MILAPQGQPHFYEEKAKAIRDVRRVPFTVGGFSYRQGQGGRQMSLRIAKEEFSRLKARFLKQAVTAPVENLVGELLSLSVLRYATVGQQMVMLVKSNNRVRHLAGLEQVPIQCVLSSNLRYARYARVKQVEDSNG